ncbi:MAG: YebC/PmpR family DNA-binding transcriptional regulator [Candidatus Bathyarchaeota archaeon]|nr:YebC/PmpR family DNA-binding transcriptional regulator [Candidatus Bathyarchaeota archaeon]
MSGHSKWANIKHKKETEDKKRAKVFSKFARLISATARDRGDNPETNAALRAAIEKARSFNMPRENIERAVKRGVGEIGGIKFESLLLEGIGPGGIAVILEALTDNKNRTLAEIRQILERFGGKLTTGGILWMFVRRGTILIKIKSQNKDVDIEKLELLLIEEGAEDIKVKDNILEIYTKPEELEKFKKLLKDKDINVEDSSLDLVPKEEIKIKGEELKNRIKSLFSTLDDREDIQEIYSNIKEL